jgi:hypothetical protein
MQYEGICSRCHQRVVMVTGLIVGKGERTFWKHEDAPADGHRIPLVVDIQQVKEDA